MIAEALPLCSAMNLFEVHYWCGDTLFLRYCYTGETNVGLFTLKLTAVARNTERASHQIPKRAPPSLKGFSSAATLHAKTFSSSAASTLCFSAVAATHCLLTTPLACASLRICAS